MNDNILNYTSSMSDLNEMCIDFAERNRKSGLKEDGQIGRPSCICGDGGNIVNIVWVFEDEVFVWQPRQWCQTWLLVSPTHQMQVLKCV